MLYRKIWGRDLLICKRYKMKKNQKNVKLTAAHQYAHSGTHSIKLGTHPHIYVRKIVCLREDIQNNITDYYYTVYH